MGALLATHSYAGRRILLGSCSTPASPLPREVPAGQSAYGTAASAERRSIRAASVPKPASAAVVLLDRAHRQGQGDGARAQRLRRRGTCRAAEGARRGVQRNVTVDNATYFNAAFDARVVYYHKENSAEAEELAGFVEGGRARKRWPPLRQRWSEDGRGYDIACFRWAILRLAASPPLGVRKYDVRPNVINKVSFGGIIEHGLDEEQPLVEAIIPASVTFTAKDQQGNDVVARLTGVAVLLVVIYRH